MDRLRRAYSSLPARLRDRLRPVVGRLSSAPEEDDETHPERLAILPFVVGRCLEVGCGHRKTADGVIGLDWIPGGQPGSVGNVAGRISTADVSANGMFLPFRDRAFDSVIARHNLEHYVDVVAVLQEWRRVLREDGVLAVIVPDEDAYAGRTVELDPTHYHAFSSAALANLVEVVGGFTEVATSVAVPNWSFMLVARRS